MHDKPRTSAFTSAGVGAATTCRRPCYPGYAKTFARSNKTARAYGL